MKSHCGKTIHGLLFISVLSLVALQTIFKPFDNGYLEGVVLAEDAPAPTIDTILSGDYATGIEAKINQELGFKPFLVRLDSQFNYSLLHHIRPGNTKVAIGKEGWLYEVGYFYYKTHPGDMEESQARSFASDLRQIQDYFQNRQSDLFVIVTPSKATVYPEFTPDRIRKYYYSESEQSNYEKLRHFFSERGVNVIDGVEWFLRRKAEEPDYLLFSRGGTHWSDMGAFEFLQHAVETINSSPNITLPPLLSSSTDSAPSRGRDRDILGTVNLLDQTIGLDSMPYPRLIKNPQSEHSTSATIIADSFAWGINEYLMAANVVGSLDMYYYMESIKQYRGDKQTQVPVAPIDIESLAQPGKVTILLCNEISISLRFWGFVDQAVAHIKTVE